MLNKQLLFGITLVLTLLGSSQALNIKVRNDLDVRTSQRIKDIIDNMDVDECQNEGESSSDICEKTISSYLKKYNNLSDIQKKELKRILFTSGKDLLLSDKTNNLYDTKIKSYIYLLVDSLFKKINNQDELDMLVAELIYNINQELDNKEIDKGLKNVLINIKSYINLKYVEKSMLL